MAKQHKAAIPRNSSDAGAAATTSSRADTASFPQYNCRERFYAVRRSGVRFVFETKTFTWSIHSRFWDVWIMAIEKASIMMRLSSSSITCTQM